MPKISKNSEFGRSMIEMLGVLAIIGVLSVGGIAGYSKAMMKYKTNKTIDQITQISQNIRTFFHSQKDYRAFFSDNYSDVTLSQSLLLKKGHLIPDEMWNAEGTAIEHAFGGRVDIRRAARTSSDDNKAFKIILYNIPREACIEILTYDWGSGSSSGLIAVGKEEDSDSILEGCAGDNISDAYAYACPNGTSVAVPMPVSIAAAACSSDGENTIVLKFY